MNPQLLGTIRHILTLMGGFAVAMGLLTEDTVLGLTDALLAITGGVVTLIGFIMSWKAPEKK